MALHPDFPQSPYETLIPGYRWIAAPKKNSDSPDIPLPELGRRYVRNFKDLSALDPATFGNKRLPLKSFTEEETRGMIFKKLLDSGIDHTIHLDDVKADGEPSTYTPDFIVRDTSGTVWTIETKGREELDIPQQTARLKQWCEDATAAEQEEGGMGIRYDFLYVDEDGFRKHEPKSLADLTASFTEYTP